ncbi:hypothetical protein [Parabacteroides faecis]|uniref:hypothetical protein n=1 Tax=Parabacteroides faecis TaxID=1217282 RepID=UPI003520AE10
MGKITVKHYLNTDVQKEQLVSYHLDKECNFVLNENEILYPVYLQITVNRKTTKLRSTTQCRLTKSDFLKYTQKGTYGGEKQSNAYNTTYYLKNEIEQITTSLDYFYNKQKGDQKKVSIKNVVNFYMKDFDSPTFLKHVNTETLFTLEYEKYKYIHDIIKEDVNPLAVESFFSEQLKIDLYSLSRNVAGGDWGRIYKSVVLFFSLMPKDKNGRVIGKSINWFCGNLKDEFKSRLIKKGVDAELYFQSFHYICKLWEDLNIIQKFQFVQD